ncbi:helix-turn-helix domain-containing protein [Hymenobacter swuensis]|nr:helix-turn-helix domain-containing protein [Hymenobacter swuensis]
MKQIVHIYISSDYYTFPPMSHQGEILQEVIKNSGISITRIVDELGITRPTIYRKFKDETLDYNFVKRIGEIIGHDFSQDFTSLHQVVLPFSVTPVSHGVSVMSDKGVTHKSTVTPMIESDSLKQLMQLQQKYIALLEAYNELLLKVYGPK